MGAVKEQSGSRWIEDNVIKIQFTREIYKTLGANSPTALTTAEIANFQRVLSQIQSPGLTPRAVILSDLAVSSPPTQLTSWQKVIIGLHRKRTLRYIQSQSRSMTFLILSNCPYARHSCEFNSTPGYRRGKQMEAAARLNIYLGWNNTVHCERGWSSAAVKYRQTTSLSVTKWNVM